MRGDIIKGSHTIETLQYIVRDIGEKKVERFLAQRHGRGKTLSRRTQTMLSQVIDDCKHLIKPLVVYVEKSIRKVGNGKLVLEDGLTFDGSGLSGAMRKCQSATVFLITIGNELDRKISDLLRKKQLTRAYMYDAVGSVAAEETAETFQNMFDSRVNKKGLATTLRFSPGYCDWPLEEQKKLFRVIDSSVIGVELRPTSLMRPSKSISGIFGVGNAGDIEKKKSNPCVSCSHETCLMRRTV